MLERYVFSERCETLESPSHAPLGPSSAALVSALAPSMHLRLSNPYCGLTTQDFSDAIAMTKTEEELDMVGCLLRVSSFLVRLSYAGVSVPLCHRLSAALPPAGLISVSHCSAST